MFPILFQIGSIPIHTYGFLIAIGFLIAVSVVKRLGIKEGIDPNVTVDYAFWTLVTGFIGARVLFVITRWEYFMRDPIAIFKIWEGGLVFLGGPIAAVPFTIWYMRKHSLKFWKTTDAMISGLVIAHAFGRLGCFSAGCCYGRPTGGDWGLRFQSELVDVSLRGIPLHPTQLYESFSLIVLFFGLLWVQKHKIFDGQTFLTYFLAYPIIRSIIEVFRGDQIRGFVIEGVLSTSQFISGLIFIAAVVAYVVRYRTAKTQ